MHEDAAAGAAAASAITTSDQQISGGADAGPRNLDDLATGQPAAPRSLQPDDAGREGSPTALRLMTLDHRHVGADAPLVRGSAREVRARRQDQPLTSGGTVNRGIG